MDRVGLAKKLGAEFVGTFSLIFVGCGAIVSDALSGGQLGHLGVALSFGLVILIMVCATGHISGAHFNPSVTFAFALDGRFPWTQVLPYMGTQILAAILASVAVASLVGTQGQLGLTSTELSLGRAFGVEVVLTMILMFVISAVATDARAHGQMAGIAIGGTVAVAALFGGPLTGASMNPARSLGPAVITGEFGQLWIYIAAPLLGAPFGSLVYRLVRCEDESSDLDATGCC